MNAFGFIPFRPPTHSPYQGTRSLSRLLHLDLVLLFGLFLLACIGLVILYSAASKDLNQLLKQMGHLGLAFLFLLFFAQIPPSKYRFWAPIIYLIGLLCLVAVLEIGKVTNGARRWLDFFGFRFQPAEIAKLAVPMILAWYFSVKHLPPSKKELAIATLLLIIPVALTLKQPDLGTAMMIAFSGAAVILLAGLNTRALILLGLVTAISLPLIWHGLHDYQQQRLLTLLNPERDPLGKGYHIIQSKIAIGSGGLWGKGWLNGTQSHLNFLPEHETDFIFAVIGEEFGLAGGILLIIVYLFITLRCVYISSLAQDTFSRLLAGSLSYTFFISYFVNIGMVCGILPVVGIPLPLVSYGGTSMVTLVICFGIMMSIHTHRRLITN